MPAWLTGTVCDISRGSSVPPEGWGTTYRQCCSWPQPHRPTDHHSRAHQQQDRSNGWSAPGKRPSTERGQDAYKCVTARALVSLPKNAEVVAQACHPCPALEHWAAWSTGPPGAAELRIMSIMRISTPPIFPLSQDVTFSFRWCSSSAFGWRRQWVGLPRRAGASPRPIGYSPPFQ
jgi:hypothetical protein